MPRFEDRYSYISVGLRYRLDDHWHPLRAVGWNANGFNFHSAHVIAGDQVWLKRGLSRFEGSIVWRTDHSDHDNDNDRILSMLINERLFQKAREITANRSLHARLVRLIRSPLPVSEKRSVLASCGVDTSDAALAEWVAQHNREPLLYRYGVKVDSDVWRAVVDDALQVSAAVASLEKVSDALALGDRPRAVPRST